MEGVKRDDSSGETVCGQQSEKNRDTGGIDVSQTEIEKLQCELKSCKEETEELRSGRRLLWDQLEEARRATAHALSAVENHVFDEELVRRDDSHVASKGASVLASEAVQTDSLDLSDELQQGGPKLSDQPTALPIDVGRFIVEAFADWQEYYPRLREELGLAQGLVRQLQQPGVCLSNCMASTCT